MNESLRYTKGLGNAEIYVRIPSAGTFWDFTASAWSGTEITTCRVFMTEFPDTSTLTSWYLAEFTPPVGGPYSVEIVRLSTGEVVGNDIIYASPGGTVTPTTGFVVQDIFKAAMEIIGATTLDETPEASELQKCLRHANLLLDSLSARKLVQLSIIQENFPLVAKQRSYTIGVGANFNTSKPIDITGAFIRDASGNDYPVDVKTREVYDSYSDKTISSARPDALFYDPGVTQQAAQTGTIYCYPVPDSSTDKLFINSEKYFTEFVNLTDSVTFPPAYYRMLVYNLAVAIWRPMGRTGPVPDDVAWGARESMRIVENMNAKQVVSGLDVPSARAGRYNIYTDGYN